MNGGDRRLGPTTARRLGRASNPRDPTGRLPRRTCRGANGKRRKETFHVKHGDVPSHRTTLLAPQTGAGRKPPWIGRQRAGKEALLCRLAPVRRGGRSSPPSMRRRSAFEREAGSSFPDDEAPEASLSGNRRTCPKEIPMHRSDRANAAGCAESRRVRDSSLKSLGSRAASGPTKFLPFLVCGHGTTSPHAQGKGRGKERKSLLRRRTGPVRRQSSRLQNLRRESHPCQRPKKAPAR